MMATEQQTAAGVRRVRWTCRQCGDQVEAEATAGAREVECPVCGTRRTIAAADASAPPTLPSEALAQAIAGSRRASPAPQGWTISAENERIIRRAVRRGALDAAATLIVFWLALCFVSAIAWVLVSRL